MVPYGCYFIEVGQDCAWSYGPDETPPASVPLYSKASADGLSHTVNLAPYCGPEQLPDKALAAIWSYLIGGLYYDNVQKSYLNIDPNSNMVPDTPYGIWVSQDCIWDFVPAELVPQVSDFAIADYVKV